MKLLALALLLCACGQDVVQVPGELPPIVASPAPAPHPSADASPDAGVLDAGHDAHYCHRDGSR